jgi:2-polyprenyl-6-methoxyphenol hydroxylase-like FAD-dependent oxidoreductase
VEYIFGDELEILVEKGNEVEVWFKTGIEKKVFNLVVAADGLGSTIRGMIFGKVETNIYSLNFYVS